MCQPLIDLGEEDPLSCAGQIHQKTGLFDLVVLELEFVHACDILHRHSHQHASTNVPVSDSILETMGRAVLR